MGTPAFAVPSLESLRLAHDVVLVVTRPDAIAGRGGRLRHSEVKAAAEAAGLPVLECATLRGEPTERVAAAVPDVICVAAFGVLLPPETLAVPRFGCINVHASLLPRHRGAAPVQRAVLEGDAQTGVSIMRMEKGLDTGPYALQRTVAVADRCASDIEAELAHVGAQALLEVLELIADGTVQWTPQDDSAATYAAKITKDDVALAPELTVRDALARIHAATRHAPARARVGGIELTVVRAHPGAEALSPGAVSLASAAPALGLADGALVLDIVRPAGKGDMPGDAWARGARLPLVPSWGGTR